MRHDNKCLGWSMNPANAARRLLAASLCLGLTVAAHAFGPTGHRAIGAVADQLLSDEARRQVRALLAEDLDKFEQPSGRRTLESVAVWADEIRSTPANRPTWHYDNVPVCSPALPPDEACKGSACASQKIQEFTATIADTSRPLRTRNEALKWLVHLVGDVHQPLHAATNFYAEDVLDAAGNDSDRGGNGVIVVLEGAKTKGSRKLHGVWDTDLVNLAFARAASSSKALPPEAITQLTQQARRVAAAKLDSPVQDWVAESNELARKTVYQFEGFQCFEPVEDTVILDQAYITKAKKLLPRQMALAGARLAHLLNTALGSH